ncbi:MAG TPA: hypothetical protein VFZ89_18575, partial [Solirubrobacteraceae bacterium]
ALLWMLRPLRRELAIGLGACLLVQAIVWGVWFGPGDLWRGAVTAQMEIGSKGGHDAAAYMAQTGWSLLPLLVLGYLGWRICRGRGEDDLLRANVAVAVGSIVTLLSISKLGTLPVILIPVEAVLLPLALVAVSRAWPRPAVVGAVALSVLATGALLVSPGAPRGFTWPGGETNWARVGTEAQVYAQQRAAERCAADTAWPGVVWVAVLADRRVPGNQADPFILQAPAYAKNLARARGDRRCVPRGVTLSDLAALQ